MIGQLLSKGAVPVGVVGIILLLIVPIPVGLLDLLIVTNIAFALLILLTAMFVKKPLDFSVFPSLLLVATLFRLGLNVASTRLVLSEAHAGQVIQAFGQITISGSLVIGFVIFLILAVIQFVVVTKGAERVAEVGARFTLDAMPGKQMAIDADLNAGLITDEQARARRAEVAAEADFYGAMDGASKFVKGDAIAGIVILVINFVGGIIIGMTMHGMAIDKALETYSLLTIGDGLVTQIPALLMAVSTGMIVTRENAEAELGRAAGRQLLQSRTALLITAMAAIAMGLIPGMPFLAFLAIGAALLFAASRVKANTDRAAADVADAEARERAEAAATEGPDDLMDTMRVHALEISLAPDIVDLAAGGAGDLLSRVKSLRRKVALELGTLMPPVRTRDNVGLPAETYAILVAGIEVGRGVVPRGHVLAIGAGLQHLPGTAVVDPVFGLDGKWVPTEMSHAADMAGATVIDRASVIITHLSDIVHAHAHRLLSLEDVRQLTDHLKQTQPSVVEELTPALLPLALVQRVLASLLAERVPINDLGRIYESLALRAKSTTEVPALVEAARAALGPAIPTRFAQDGRLRVVMFDTLLEQQMLEGLRHVEGRAQIVLNADQTMQLMEGVRRVIADIDPVGGEPVLVCAPSLRQGVRALLAGQVAGMPILSYDEAAAGGFATDVVGVVRPVQAALPSS
ncbi:flagellar biosynthesis protein FlhA [Microbacterium sp. AG157]|uniref:flagellar biosynthesis protein FlhA n=1 Tax=Microbacterium TaxID=33882 RepID=UPI000CCFB632|nr:MULTISPECIES: flagellar biosynthesis protein FlhA [Microbacterium]PNW07889.1 EscV/YscV/HrcV family type III secretion system export apparatus protein [Microbacterium testaceum]REC99440.1 flagellar biosynthesis protein FlhA [Microbacterium sp. AG157]